MILIVKSAVQYTRVSSKEQLEKGFSIPAQEDLLAAYALEKSVKIVARFSDDETAKTEGRPGFARMLRYLQAHQSVRIVLVEKTDRLYRNLKDWISLEDLKVEIHFAREGSVISPESHSSARFLHGIKVLMAKNYVENLSEEIRKGMTKKAEQGAFPSVAPIGYRNIADKTKGIEPDPEYAPLVAELFDRTAAGHHTAQELTRYARTMGLRSKKRRVLSKNTVCTNILRNPAYHGSFRWGGKVYRGNYAPLITKATFDRAQRALDGRSKAKGQKHQFTYSGLVTCSGCGRLMSGSLQKGRFVYYVCNGPRDCRKFWPERILEAETLRILSALQIDQAVSDWLLQDIEARQDEAIDERQIRGLQKRRQEVQKLRKQAYEDKVLGDIDAAFWRDQTASWQRELEEIDEELVSLANVVSKEDLLAAARRPIELLQAAPDVFVSQEPADRAHFLKTFVSNYTIKGGSVSVALRSPFDVLLRGAETKDWWS